MRKGLPGSTVLFTGAIGAFMQYLVASNTSNSHTVSAITGAVLTVAVAVHGALTTSIFEHSHTAQTVDKGVVETEQILGDVQNQLGEK